MFYCLFATFDSAMGNLNLFWPYNLKPKHMYLTIFSFVPKLTRWQMHEQQEENGDQEK